MGVTRNSHTKWSKSERQIPYDDIYMWNLKYGTNEPIYKTETDSQTWRTDLWLLWGEHGMNWEFGVNRRKLFHLEWISNEVLLYRTGNYIVSWDRTWWNIIKGMYIYVWLGHTYIYVWLRCTAEIGTTL